MASGTIYTGWLKKVSCWHSTTAYFFEPPCRSVVLTRMPQIIIPGTCWLVIVYAQNSSRYLIKPKPG